jgi:hypothetical protein
MRYIMMVKATAGYEAGEQPSEKLQALMGEYVGNSMKAGTFIDGAGLQPTRNGARMQLRDGAISITDGPFALTDGVVSGFAIVEVPDDAAARQVGREFLEVHIRGGVREIDIEIRPYEAE